MNSLLGRLARPAIFLFALLCLIGCAAQGNGLAGPPRASEPSWANWAQSQGGLADYGLRWQRASAAGERLAARRMAISIHVLDTAAVTAYSFADGHVFVTRGLVDVATDDQLAAAIAHEMGHLLSDGHVAWSGFRAIAGHGEADKEVQADMVGVQLLRARGISPGALAQMLRKVVVATPSKATQESLRARIGRLER